MNEDRWRNIVLYFEMSVNVGVSHIWEENQIYQMPHIPGTNLTEKYFFVKYGLKDEYTNGDSVECGDDKTSFGAEFLLFFVCFLFCQSLIT